MSPRSSGRATTRDVAARAGVSIATASRALNDRGDVSPETRERVRQAAAELSFELPARGGRTPHDRQLTVGILTSDSVGRFSIPVMLGAEDALGAGGRVAVLLCDARGDAIREQHYLQVLLERQVDGIIVVGQRTDPRPPLATTGDVPVVYAYAPSADPADVSHVPDNIGGAALAVRHLLDLGRTRIAHVTGPRDYAATRERMHGLDVALEQAGTSLVGEVIHGGDWSQAWGRHAATILLGRNPDVDAIFCGSDQVAAGVLDTLRDSGRQVPDDVSVVGYDNWEVIATDTRPPLTTVDMNLEDLGRAAAQSLFAMMDGPVEAGVHARPCRLVIRQSTAPVSASVPR